MPNQPTGSGQNPPPPPPPVPPPPATQPAQQPATQPVGQPAQQPAQQPAGAVPANVFVQPASGGNPALAPQPTPRARRRSTPAAATTPPVNTTTPPPPPPGANAPSGPGVARAFGEITGKIFLILWIIILLLILGFLVWHFGPKVIAWSKSVFNSTKPPVQSVQSAVVEDRDREIAHLRSQLAQKDAVLGSSNVIALSGDHKYVKGAGGTVTLPSTGPAVGINGNNNIVAMGYNVNISNPNGWPSEWQPTMSDLYVGKDIRCGKIGVPVTPREVQRIVFPTKGWRIIVDVNACHNFDVKCGNDQECQTYSSGAPGTPPMDIGNQLRIKAKPHMTRTTIVLVMIYCPNTRCPDCHLKYRRPGKKDHDD